MALRYWACGSQWAPIPRPAGTPMCHATTWQSTCLPSVPSTSSGAAHISGHHLGWGSHSSSSSSYSGHIRLLAAVGATSHETQFSTATAPQSSPQHQRQEQQQQQQPTPDLDSHGLLQQLPAPAYATPGNHLATLTPSAASGHPFSPIIAAADAAPPSGSSSASSSGSGDPQAPLATSSLAEPRRMPSSSSSLEADGAGKSSRAGPRTPRPKPQRRNNQQQQQQQPRREQPPELTTIQASPRQQQLAAQAQQQLELLEQRKEEAAQQGSTRVTSRVDQVTETILSTTSAQMTELTATTLETTTTIATTSSSSTTAAAPPAEEERQAAAAAAAAARPASSTSVSPLHWDIVEFAAAVVPTADELALKRQVIQLVQGCVYSLDSFDRAGVEVQPFGSFVSGLGTWDSDVDLVISGLVEPDKASGGFPQQVKKRVARLLDKVAARMRSYRKLGVRKLSVIPHARIPIIKAAMRNGVTADISLGDESGPRAANFVRQQMAAYAPLAPLVLTLKVFLRSAGLNEVANGGLSSFSLTNMVLAHLQEDLKAGMDIYDLGESLYGFFCRYGDDFDYDADAVSVASGGIIPRELLNMPAGESYITGDVRLCINDPLTGRDVSAGSYRMQEVRAAFSKAARRLESMVSQYSSVSGSNRGTRVNYLGCLFDPVKAIDRGQGSVKTPMMLGKRPPYVQDAFQDNLLYDELDLTGDEDELDDVMMGTWVTQQPGVNRRRR